MAYQKFYVDNVTCSRRFHITCDTAGPKQPVVELRCSYCDMVIFKEKNHPAVKLARQENLVQTAALSDNIMRECHFKDAFSKKTGQPSKDANGNLYPTP